MARADLARGCAVTTISDLTPAVLSDVEVREAVAAFTHAVQGNFLRMRRMVEQLSPSAAEDLMLACEVLSASLAHRAYGRGRPTPPLVAVAALTPDSEVLP